MLKNYSSIAFLIPAATGLTISSSSFDAPSNIVSEKIKNNIECGGNSSRLNSITGIASWETLQKVQSLYEIESSMDVFSFLNEQTADLMIASESVIREYFDCAKLSLKLKYDFDDGSSVLLLTIHSNSDWMESEKRLDKFDRNWWLAQKWFPSNKRICIDVISA